MSRPLERRQLTREELWMQEIRVRGVSKRLPQDSRHLSNCLNALLRRGLINSPSKAEWLKREIEEIAGLEDILRDADHDLRYLIEQAINAKVTMLEHGSVTKIKEHIPEVMRIQRKIIADALLDTLKGYYSEERNMLWYQKHWERLEGDLKIIPCWCVYSPLRLNKIIYEESPREILLTILAAIHGSTSQAVSTILSERTY